MTDQTQDRPSWRRANRAEVMSWVGIGICTVIAVEAVAVFGYALYLVSL